MAYIGRSPEYGNAVSQQITGTNSVGPYTLSYDTSTSGVVVSLDGVVQRNSVDFNIVGTALTFTSTVGTGIIINVVFTGLTLSFPTPSDGSVTDAKIVDMAASKLTGTIADARFPATLPAASGVNLTALNATNLGSGTVPTARLGSGTASSSTFLRGDQTYAAAGGGAWTLIGTQVASGSASLTQTGLDSTYDTYVIVFSDIIPATDGSFPWLRFGDSGGVDSGGSDYTWFYQDIRSESTSYSANVSTGDSKILVSNDVGSSTGEGFGAVFYLHRPGDGTSYPQISGTMAYMDSSGQHKGGLAFGHRISIITLDRVNFLFSSGNIASGRMSIFGISHT